LQTIGTNRVPRRDLRRLSIPELRDLVRDRGLPEYRHRQIARWLYDKGVESIDEMTDLSLSLREELAAEFEIGALREEEERVSRVDGTRKYLFRLPDGGAVESVLMPTERRVTMCISSQVGCTLDCVFCRTGQMGFLRNLEPHEILGQVLPLWRRIRDRRLRTNIVFMGMGEPLHNVPGVVAACRTLMDPLGLNLGGKRITVSTAGVVPGIRKLAESGLGVGLAVSINATTQEARERLMPRAAKTPLPELIEAARAYAERFDSRVTMEYVLMRGVNDSPEDARRLGRMFRGGPFKINIIPYNPGSGAGIERPDAERVDEFARLVWPDAPVVTVRWSMGPDIAAACGQLSTEIARARKGDPEAERPKKGPGGAETAPPRA
jgi:23S rRNA (adenine2503-C2)-methyltransferase